MSWCCLTESRRKERSLEWRSTGKSTGRRDLKPIPKRTRTSRGNRPPVQEPIMPTKRKFKSAAVQELYDELIDDDTAAQEEFEGGLVNIEAAQLIYAMRTKAGLSQRELARKVGTSASAINRL